MKQKIKTKFNRKTKLRNLKFSLNRAIKKEKKEDDLVLKDQLLTKKKDKIIKYVYESLNNNKKSVFNLLTRQQKISLSGKLIELKTPKKINDSLLIIEYENDQHLIEDIKNPILKNKIEELGISTYNIKNRNLGFAVFNNLKNIKKIIRGNISIIKGVGKKNYYSVDVTNAEFLNGELSVEKIKEISSITQNKNFLYSLTVVANDRIQNIVTANNIPTLFIFFSENYNLYFKYLSKKATSNNKNFQFKIKFSLDEGVK